MLEVNWIKCGSNNGWCPLENLNLKSVESTGVYIIWHAGNPSRVVRVGQGQVSNRLSEHRNNPEILGYKQYGKLHVTWATIPAHQIDGVERYLADKWNPLVGDAFPDVYPIAVNSPF